MSMKNKRRNLSINAIILCTTVMTFVIAILENAFNPDNANYILIFLIIGTATIYCINKLMDRYY